MRSIAFSLFALFLSGCLDERSTITTGAARSAIFENLSESSRAKSILDYGAKGDGQTDDTASIQQALDANAVVYLPAPAVSYRVSTLRLNPQQTLIGPGKWTPCLEGDGTGAVLKAGDYAVADSTVRRISIRDLQIRNMRYPAVGLYHSPDFSIVSSYFLTTESNALELRLSYRGTIRENFIGQSGSGWALSLMDNGNAVTISNNTITGGQAGNAIDIGRSQGVRIEGNSIEVGGGYGIRIAGHPSPEYGGIASGITIEGNYLEHVRVPISIGEHYVGRGISVRNNYVGNGANQNFPEPIGFLVLERAEAVVVEGNSYVGTGVEPFIVFRYFNVGDVLNQAVRSRVANNHRMRVSADVTLEDFPSQALRQKIYVDNEINFANGSN